MFVELRYVTRSRHLLWHRPVSLPLSQATTPTCAWPYAGLVRQRAHHAAVRLRSYQQHRGVSACACSRLSLWQQPVLRLHLSAPRREVSTSRDQQPEEQQHEQSADTRSDTSSGPVDLLLYRGRWILPIRWCLRLKLFQAAGALSVANLMFVDPSSSTDVLIATSLVVSVVIYPAMRFYVC